MQPWNFKYLLRIPWLSSFLQVICNGGIGLLTWKFIFNCLVRGNSDRILHRPLVFSYLIFLFLALPFGIAEEGSNLSCLSEVAIFENYRIHSDIIAIGWMISPTDSFIWSASIKISLNLNNLQNFNTFPQNIFQIYIYYYILKNQF